MKKSAYKFYMYGAAVCLVVIIGIAYLYCFSSFSKSSSTQFVYIDTDDNIDSVYNKVSPFANNIPMQAFRTLTRHSGYATHIRTGRYAIKPGEGALKTWRHLKNGNNISRWSTWGPSRRSGACDRQRSSADCRTSADKQPVHSNTCS